MSVGATELRRVVEELAASRPDFRYTIPDGETSCLYTHKDEEGTEVPGCIVGHGFFGLGQPIPYESERNSLTGVASLAYLKIITGDEDDIDWLLHVQNEQDSGATWGEAVAEANRPETGSADYDF